MLWAFGESFVAGITGAMRFRATRNGLAPDLRIRVGGYVRQIPQVESLYLTQFSRRDGYGLSVICEGETLEYVDGSIEFDSSA